VENLFLIVGLGNPGKEYAKTRHNAGFLLVEKLAKDWRADWTAEKKFSSRLAKVERGGRKFVLCQPQTFMNASGEAVRAMSDFFRLPPEKILLVVDDADLPFGEIRLRGSGSSGGHHGLESVEEADLLEKVLARAAKQVEYWASDGIAKAMSQFNGVVNKEEKGTE